MLTVTVADISLIPGLETGVVLQSLGITHCNRSRYIPDPWVGDGGYFTQM